MAMHNFPKFLILRRRAYRYGFIAGMLMSVCPLAAVAQERQYKIEAAYLYSLFNYITWPGYASPQALRAPTICVYGDDPILPYLEYIGYKMTQERIITVMAVTDADSTRNCNMLFARHRLPYRLLRAADSHMLVVFKSDDPLDRGGMIELSDDYEEERIAIRIDQEELERHGFRVSSRLLELASNMR